MALEVVSPFITWLIVTFALGGSIAPAYAFTNRFLRDEPFEWNRSAGIGIMLLGGCLFAGLITVNGVVGTSYQMISTQSAASFIIVFLAAIFGMAVGGLLLMYPLHYFLKWQEPPKLIEEYQP